MHIGTVPIVSLPGVGRTCVEQGAHAFVWVEPALAENRKKEVEMGSSEAIRDLLEPALASAGLELWDVEVSRQMVRVLVDRPGGIDLDSLATVASGVVSPLLDSHPDLTPDGRFALEVSSPGMERPLRTVEQYLRYLGSEVSVKTSVPVAGSRRHRGELVSADGLRVRIRVADPAVPGDASAGEIELPVDQIERARTVVDWGAPKDGVARRGSGHKSAAPREKVPMGAPSSASPTAAPDDFKDTAS
jgi:ribosome maturation factor RimP